MDETADNSIEHSFHEKSFQSFYFHKENNYNDSSKETNALNIFKDKQQEHKDKNILKQINK